MESAAPRTVGAAAASQRLPCHGAATHVASCSGCRGPVAVQVQQQQLSRRRLHAALLSLGGGLALLSAPTQAMEVPPPPPVGDCPDCIGEMDDALNACRMDAPSCVSVASDDESHFYVPWTFEVDRKTAADKLVAMATSGGEVSAMSGDPFGVPRGAAAGFILGGVAAVVSGGKMPDQPQREKTQRYMSFGGRLVERYATPRGSEYVRLVFGEDGESPAGVIDAEFVFLEGDSIVDVRAASRAAPAAGNGILGLSLDTGLAFDRNVARRRMEELRKALGWQPAPVLSSFDSERKPLLADKLFESVRGNWGVWSEFYVPPDSYNSGDCDQYGPDGTYSNACTRQQRAP